MDVYKHRHATHLFILEVFLNPEARRKLNKRVIYVCDNGRDRWRSGPAARSSVRYVYADQHSLFLPEPLHIGIIKLFQMISYS